MRPKELFLRQLPEGTGIVFDDGLPTELSKDETTAILGYFDDGKKVADLQGYLIHKTALKVFVKKSDGDRMQPRELSFQQLPDGTGIIFRDKLPTKLNKDETTAMLSYFPDGKEVADFQGARIYKIALKVFVKKPA